MKNKFKLDFNAVCRLCLNEGPELRSIFDCNVDYPCRIESCVGLKVSKNIPHATKVVAHYYFTLFVAGTSRRSWPRPNVCQVLGSLGKLGRV